MSARTEDRTSDGDRPRVSVVIRCYNEAEHIGKLLAGIADQTVDDVEVVVVDSGSTDGTVEIVRSFPLDIELLEISPEEFSFGRALNLGCEAATAPIIAIASAHVYPVYRTWLEYLIRPFQESEVALAYGKQRGDHRTKFSERQIFQKWFPDQPNRDQASPFCNNANAAIRRSVWASNPYDEDLTGLEDLAWARRAQARGWRVDYVPEAVVVHVHEESPRQIYNRYRREAIALNRIFPDQRFRFRDFVWLTLSNIVSDYWHAFREGQLLGSLLEIPLFRTLQFWGTYRGFSWEGQVTAELKRAFYYPRRVAPGDREDQASHPPEARIDYSSVAVGGDDGPTTAEDQHQPTEVGETR